MSLVIMGVNYNFLYFSGDDSDYDYNVDSNEELGRGTSLIVFFLTFLTNNFSKHIACFHFFRHYSQQDWWMVKQNNQLLRLLAQPYH